MDIVFRSSVEGLRALLSGQVVGVIYNPARRGGDYWCKIMSTGVVYKGLTLDAARERIVDIVRALEDARQRTVEEARRLAAQAVTPKPVQLPTPRYEHGSLIARTPSSARKRERAASVVPTLTPCPVCKVPVGNVKKHMRKRHSSERVPTTIPKVASPARRPSAVATPAPLRPAPRRQGAPPSKEYPRKLTLLVERAGTALQVRCPVCRGYSRRAHIFEHLSRAHPTIDTSGWRVGPEPSKRASKPAPARGTSSKQDKGRKAKKSAASKDRSVTLRTAVTPPAEIHERAHDATQLYAHRYRERGRFGSHAAHDGYADDDRP